MMFQYYLEQLRTLLYTVPVILIAITFHEYAHGWVSEKLGDPTPRLEGRMSLNPLKHLDLAGTLCLIFFHVGWAKPVRINTRYYKDRRKGIILVSLAGPVMNFIIAFLSLVLCMLFAVYGGEDSAFAQIVFLLCYYSVQMNIGLGVFNLIPFPPLDGSNVLEQIYPKVAYFYARIRPYRTLILVVLLMSGALSYPMNSVGNWLFRLMWTIVSALMGIDSGGTIIPAGGTYV